jgi:hypothetical protein
VTIARSLCWRHYQQQRRVTGDWLDELEADALKLATSSHNGYDRRFVGLFLDELSRRNSPRFPEGGWFNALGRADYDFRQLGPLKPLPTGHSHSGLNHYPETSSR